MTFSQIAPRKVILNRFLTIQISFCYHIHSLNTNIINMNFENVVAWADIKLKEKICGIKTRQLLQGYWVEAAGRPAGPPPPGPPVCSPSCRIESPLSAVFKSLPLPYPGGPSSETLYSLAGNSRAYICIGFSGEYLRWVK